MPHDGEGTQGTDDQGNEGSQYSDRCTDLQRIPETLRIPGSENPLGGKLSVESLLKAAGMTTAIGKAKNARTTPTYMFNTFSLVIFIVLHASVLQGRRSIAPEA